jgi:hypothetical protein
MRRQRHPKPKNSKTGGIRPSVEPVLRVEGGVIRKKAEFDVQFYRGRRIVNGEQFFE